MKKELQDYVWQNCLPKEFKEEVKKLYSRFLFTREGYYDELFGKHNLNSDAEGEDELLTANKKDVQEQYALQIAALRKGNLSDIEVEYRVKLKDMLEYLFGSKCLPDNVDSSESNVDSSHDNVDSSRGNVDSLEPNPDGLNEDNFAKSEPKFKMGDMVKDISSPHDGGIYKVDDIKKSSDGFIYHIQGLIGKSNVKESSLEPYNEPKEENHIAQDLEMVDTIIKDGFREHNRLHIAAMIMAAMMQNAKWGDKYSHIATISCAAADALIIEVEKNK